MSQFLDVRARSLIIHGRLYLYEEKHIEFESESCETGSRREKYNMG